MERIKVCLQTQDQVIGGKKYNGMLDAGKGMFKEGGVSSLYRGTIATLARDIPGSAAYFVGYEYFYRMMRENGYSLTSSALVSGGMLNL